MNNPYTEEKPIVATLESKQDIRPHMIEAPSLASGLVLMFVYFKMTNQIDYSWFWLPLIWFGPSFLTVMVLGAATEWLARKVRRAREEFSSCYAAFQDLGPELERIGKKLELIKEWRSGNGLDS